jgi:hypothetical protein
MTDIQILLKFLKNGVNFTSLASIIYSLSSHEIIASIIYSLSSHEIIEHLKKRQNKLIQYTQKIERKYKRERNIWT